MQHRKGRTRPLSLGGLRHHFRRDGTAKKSYTQAEAILVADKIPGQTPYRCRICGRWHLATEK